MAHQSEKEQGKGQTHSSQGARDFIVLSVLALILIGGFVALAFKLIDQEDEHVRKVEKVHISESYSDDMIDKNEAKDSVSRMLKSEPGSEELDFSAINVTDKEMPEIAQFRRMKKLDLGHAKVSDKGLQLLAGMPLTELSVAGTEISDKGLDTVATMKDLVKLDLTECDITNSGIAKLTALPKLVILNVAKTKVDDHGVVLMEKIESLGKIDLTGCRVTDESLKVVSRMRLSTVLFEKCPITGYGIRKNLRSDTLKKISLDACPIRDSDLPWIAQAVPNLTVLDIAGTQISDQGLSELVKLKRLNTVKVQFCENLSKKGIEDFQRLKPGVKVENDFIQ